MKNLTRRKFILTGSILPLISCTQISSNISPLKSQAQLVKEVREAKNVMNSQIPGSVELQKESKGMLIIPRVSDASFWVGGAYGEGGLLIGDAIVSYFSMAQASIGIKIGAQEYSHALFFMTSKSLKEFRSSEGWSLGVDAEYVTAENSGWIGQDAIKPATDIIALTYDRSGVALGGSLEGIKYSPIYKN